MKSSTYRRARTLVGLLAVLGGAAAFWYLTRKLLVIRRVVCSVGDQSCDAAVQADLDRTMRDQSVFFTDFDAILSGLPSLQSMRVVHLHKKLPGTILVDLQGELLAYQLQLVEGKTRVVGERGSLKNSSESAPSNLPVVELRTQDTQLLEDVRDAAQIPPQLHAVFMPLITALHDNHLSYQKITWFSADEIRVQLDTYQAILDDQNPAGSVEALAQILGSEEVKQLPKPLKEVDLRFTLPVLRTQE